MRLVLSTLMSRSNENKSCGRVDEKWRSTERELHMHLSSSFHRSLHAETRKIFTTLLSTSTASRNLRLCKQGLILLYWGEGVRYFARLKTRIARLSISNKSQFRYRSLYHKACKRKSILSIHLQLTRWTVQLPNQIARFLGTICLTFNCALPPPPPRKRIHSCVRYYYVAFALCFVLCFNENPAYHVHLLSLQEVNFKFVFFSCMFREQECSCFLDLRFTLLFVTKNMVKLTTLVNLVLRYNYLALFTEFRT